MDAADRTRSVTAIGKSRGLQATSDRKALSASERSEPASETHAAPHGKSVVGFAFAQIESADSCGAARLVCHHHRRMVADAAVEISDVFVVHADASVGDEAADR